MAFQEEGIFLDPNNEDHMGWLLKDMLTPEESEAHSKILMAMSGLSYRSTIKVLNQILEEYESDAESFAGVQDSTNPEDLSFLHTGFSADFIY